MVQVSKHIPKSPKQAACCSSELDDLLNAELFKALGDPTRLKLFSCLARCARPCSTTEVAECCDVDFSVVSRHLGILADAGVLESKKEGRTVYYEVRYGDFSTALRGLADAISSYCRGPRQKTGARCGC